MSHTERGGGASSLGPGWRGRRGLGNCRLACRGRLGRRSRGPRDGIRRGPGAGPLNGWAGATGRLARATGHLAPVGLPRRRRGALGLDHHMRRHGPWGIHHPAGAEGPAHWRHKSRGHKRPARACDAAIGTGRIEPRGVDGQPAPGRADALRSRRQEGDTGVGPGGR